MSGDDAGAPPPAAECCCVYVTAPNRAAAKSLAASLVEARLAACVNIVPGVESVYHWEGKVEVDEELLLIAKTTRSRLAALTEKVNAEHPYDVPEVVAIPFVGGSDKYISWLVDNVTPSARAAADGGGEREEGTQ
eukprot:PRCOL_00002052-RA